MEKISFTPLQTYKVLKPIGFDKINIIVLHHYKLTRFSNTEYLNGFLITVLHHYKLTRFSNYKINAPKVVEFYTITNLQGSQTLRTANMEKISFTPLQTYKVLKPQMRLSPSQTYWLICVSYLVMYKTHVFIY